MTDRCLPVPVWNNRISHWAHRFPAGAVRCRVACGLLPMIFMLFFVLAQNTHSAFSGYAGLFERLATNADTIWGVVVLIPLWAGRKLMRPTA